MRFLILSLISILTLTSCNSYYKPKNIVVNREYLSQDGEPTLIGQISRDVFSKEPYSQWFLETYNSYTPDNSVIRSIKKNRKHISKVEIYFGSWPSESRELLPKIMKVLDKSNIKNVKFFAVNKNLESFYGEQTQKHIYKTPTVIIYRGTQEKGRVIESSTNSIETDLLDIMQWRKRNLQNKTKK